MVNDTLALVQRLSDINPQWIIWAVLAVALCYVLSMGIWLGWMHWRDHEERKSRADRERAQREERIRIAHGLPGESVVRWPPRRAGEHDTSWKARRKDIA
ncbi:MAG: hypothetical protein IT434_09595 [Phycisphaerales bacterium]|nr:hypothetical protein [Phycisphaerales bacterium]